MEIKKQFDNEEGISHGIVAVLMFLAIASLIWICCTPIINEIIGVGNNMIESGQIGVQTAGAMEWNIALFSSIPVICLLGISVWAYIRAIEERGV